jgi:hypothetical protein
VAVAEAIAVALIARRVPLGIPVEGDIRAEAIARSADVLARSYQNLVCRKLVNDVNEVKVRGERGVLNGTPFLMPGREETIYGRA